MNKKTKFAIPFAVLALTCGIAAGCGGCAPSDSHTHDYTDWAHNDTQHWKECPDDHEKDEDTIADHVFVDGACVCGATEAPLPVVDVTITNGTTDTNGTVTIDKTTAKTGDTVTVTVAPSDGYQLKSLTVNDANVFGAMTGNTYTFKVTGDTTVVAVFEKIASSSINAQITGKKYGVTGNSIAEGTTVTLSSDGKEDITTTVKADGTIQVDEIAGADWKVKVDGYVSVNILVPRDVTYTTEIPLEYDLMENLKKTWGNTDSVDLSGQNDGKIVYQSGYVEWVSTKESYESVAITATVVKGGFRQGVFIRFAGDTYDDDKYVMVSKENNDKIGWCAMGGGADYKGSAISGWDDKIKPDGKPLPNETYELTLVRKGADVYLFVDGEYINKQTFADYADKECYVGLFCTGADTMENPERTFSIGTYEDFFKTVTITDTTAADAKGSLSFAQGDYKVGDQLVINVTPDAGCLLDSLKVNGKEVGDKVANGQLTITLTTPTVELNATFNDSAVFSATNAVCPEGTYDLDSYVINDQLVLGYKRYNGEGDAPSYGNLIGDGLDGVTRYGGDFDGSRDKVKFTADGKTNANCLFLNNGEYKDVTVTVPAGAKQILVFTGTYDGGDKTITCNLYDEDGICVGNGTFLHTRGDNPRSDLVTFTVDPTKIGEGGTYTLRIGGDCSTMVAAIVVLGDKQDVTITNGTTDENGTVTIDKTTAQTGDTVTVTFTPNEHYRIKDLKVDGQSVLSAATNGTYTFIALKDTTVVAEFEQILEVDVTLTVTATDFAGRDVTLADGTQITLADVNGFATYTYTVGADDNFTRVYAGQYNVTCDGYYKTTVTVGAEGGNIAVALTSPIATTESNEITINADKTIAIQGNGKKDREENRAISADLLLTEEQEKSTGLTLEFTAKVTKKYRNGDDWAASRFGIQMGEGAVGFFVFIRDNGTPKADVVQLNANSLDLNPGTEYKWHGDDASLSWLTLAALSEDGVQMKVVRANGIIHIYAKNGEDWVELSQLAEEKEQGMKEAGDLTIANTVKNQIKFLATGDDWLFSDIRVTLPEATEKATLTASVDNEEYGTVTTDVSNYYKGDTAIITVTAAQGYELEKLVIGDTEITEGWVKNGLVYTYELKLEGDTAVVAHIIETPTPKVTPDITAEGAKYGSTETPAIEQGLEITLTNADMETSYKGTVGADGKITFEEQLYAATYTVSAEGYFDTTVTISEEVTPITLTLYVNKVDCVVTVGETGDTAKFVAEGATVTFKKGDETKTATVTDGKVTIKDVLTGDWVTTANFGGYEIDLGTTTIDKSGKAVVTVDASGIMWSKKEQEIISSDIANATLEIKTNPQHHNQIKLATAVNGGVLAFKFALPAGTDTTADFKTAVSMPIGNGEGSLWVILFVEKSGENKTVQFAYYDKVSGGSWFDDNGTKRLDLSSYWDTLVGDGLWIAVNMNAETGALTPYVGATLETATAQNYVRTCTLTNKSINKIEIGNAVAENTNSNLVITFKYGATLEALNVGSEVVVTNVDAEITVNGTENYTAEGATLVFNHINGKDSAEGKVTDGSVVLSNIPVGTYDVSAKVNGLTVSLGQIEIGEEGAAAITLDGNTIFANAESAAAGYDLSTLAITLDLKNNGNAYHNKFVTSVPQSDTNYLFYKISLPEAMKTKLKENGGKKLNISMPIVVDGVEQVTYKVIIENGTVKYQFYGGVFNGFWGTERTLDAAYWTALVDGDGFYLVVSLDKTEKDMSVYVGTAADKLRLTQDAAKFDSIGTIGISMGNAVDAQNLDAGDQLTVTVKYGKTMEELGISLEQKVTVTATVNDETLGSVALDETEGKYYSGSKVTVTVTANHGYVLASIQVGEETITEGWKQNGDVYTYTFNAPEGGAAVVATLERSSTVDSAQITVNGGDVFTTENAKLTFECNGSTYEGTVKDGTVTIGGETPVVLGTHNVYGEIGGYLFSLGTVKIDAPEEGTTATATVNLQFQGKLDDFANAVSAVNLSTGEVKFRLGKQENGGAYNAAYDIKQIENGGYFATKLKFDNMGDNQWTSSLIFAQPNGTEYNLVVQNAQENFGVAGEFYMNLNAGDNSIFDKTNHVSLNAYADALKGDGLWIVLAYDAKTGDLVTYVGTDLGSVRLIKTWKNIGAGIKISQFGVGNWFGKGGYNDTATITLKYGETMADIGMKLEEKVTVTASVNDNAMGSVALDVTDGKYYSGTQGKIIVTANQGYTLASIQVGEETITEGWKQDGNVYTYEYTVTGDINVVATLKQVEKVAVTVKVSAKDTDGVTDVEVANGTSIQFVAEDGTGYTYVVGGETNPAEMAIGTYTVTCYGYAKTTATVTLEGGEVAVNLVKVIGYTTADEITIDSENGTISITGNGLNDREPNQRKINAEYVISEEVKNSTDITLTFTVKATKKDGRAGSDWVGSRFGVQIGEGEIGFMVFPRNDQSGTASDVAKLIPGTNLALNPDRDNQPEQKWHGDDPDLAWLADALYSENGEEFKIVRSGGVISIFAKNGEDWVALDTMGTKGETKDVADIGKLTIDDSVKNEIKFTAGGDNWTFSDISVSVNTSDEGEQA